MTGKPLRELTGQEEFRVEGPQDIIITGITADSRRVEPGFVFAALAGVKQDGLAFVPAAIDKGAVAILAARAPDAPLPPHVALILAGEPRLALSKLASGLHARQPSHIVAVTGTSGKTSVASFVRQIFCHAGFAGASIGTLGIVSPAGEEYGSLTTPDPVWLHTALDRLAGAGVTHLAMEASSHGLDQYRLDGVRLMAGAFTNLSRDHLDYHPTIEAYLEAKLRLVRELLPAGAPVVVNMDGAGADAFVAAAQARDLPLISVGERGETIRLIVRERLGAGQRLSLGGPWGRAEVMLPLAGDFQAENALVAAGLALAAGISMPRILAALENLEGVKGRLDKVGEVNGAAVYVDYAHKPGALETVLDTLRPYTAGRLVCVFGCGGDRDQGKRPIMGAISAARADVTIITDDNPRSEEPATIRKAILAACPDATEIGDRASAIRAAVAMLEAGDVLVIAGKGHEPGQIVGTTVLPFSDHDEARAAIASAKA